MTKADDRRTEETVSNAVLNLFSIILRAAFLLALVSLSNASFAESGDYSVVPGWPLLPEGFVLGRASGVAVDSHNHVFVFHSVNRDWVEPFPDEAIAGAAVIVLNGVTGEFLGEFEFEWGEKGTAACEFNLPHGPRRHALNRRVTPIKKASDLMQRIT